MTIPSISVADSRKSKTAKRREKRADADPAERMATPKTYRERTHHQHSVDGAAYVTTTNVVPRILRRANARTGSHVEAFQRDYELAHIAIKSPKMEISSGGQTTPIPLAQIQAVDRLKEFEERNQRSYLVCEAVLIHGTNATKIAEVMKTPNRVATETIRDAIDDLASFYTPQKKRPDKKLAAIAQYVEERRLRT